MEHFLTEYGLFVAKTLTFLVLILVAFAILLSLIGELKNKTPQELEVSDINQYFDGFTDYFYGNLLDEKTNKERLKTKEKEQKEKAEQWQNRPRLFVLDFEGDIEASATHDLRKHISLILQVATPEDRVLVRLESGGGLVHAYGLASSQLHRLRERQIPLTIAVDKVAASGGYMMACLGNELIAAPFAIVGSIGVVGALPNFNKVLKRFDIDYEQHTAGEHKRSLTLFGENTDADREQFQRELKNTHELFKKHIAQYRPELNLEQLATGETWYGIEALEHRLIDRIGTSDDYILAHLNSHRILHLKTPEEKQGFFQKLKGKWLKVAKAHQPPRAHIG